jgi:hypothetical protein
MDERRRSRQSALHRAWLTASALVGVSLVAADELQVPMHVGAHVAAHAELSATLPVRVTVTAGDVSRGFVEILDVTRLDILTNERAFALEIEPLPAPFSAVMITGLEQRVDIGGAGGSIVRRVTDSSHPVSLALRYRLLLDAGAAPGEYVWPVHFAVHPLQLQ